jgi:hypothetical protein
MQNRGTLIVMETNNPYIEEAVQWLRTKATLRDFADIAKDAGMKPASLKYLAMNILAGRSINKRGRPRKTN